MKEILQELELFKEYFNVYIQILPYCIECGGNRIHKPQLPTFEYFKKTYNDTSYSLVMPKYKEVKQVYDSNKLGAVHTHGLGSPNGIAYRYYNYWMGCKFFTGMNMYGDYTIDTNTINKALKGV